MARNYFRVKHQIEDDKAIGECRVQSAYFWQTYVSNRCTGEIHHAPARTFTQPGADSCWFATDRLTFHLIPPITDGQKNLCLCPQILRLQVRQNLQVSGRT
jgi:hypothetical protein